MSSIISIIIKGIFVIGFALIFWLMVSIAKMKLYVKNRILPWNLNETEKFDHEFFETISNKLEEAGFKHDNDYRMLDEEVAKTWDGKPKKEMYIRHFIHKELATAAEIIYTITRTDVKESNKITTITNYQNNLGLDTFFKSGFAVNSMTKVEPKLFEDPSTIFLTYTNFEDIDQLILEHLNLVREKTQTEELDFDMIDISVEDYINKALKIDYMKQVERKILKYNEKGNYFQFTFRGVKQVLFKSVKFEFIDKKKLQRESNKFVAKTYISKKKILPPILYHANEFFTLGVLLEITWITRRGLGNFYQQMFALFIFLGFVICMFLTWLYKRSGSNTNK